MLTQDIIEEFFLKMIEELRKDNVKILNDYKEIFRDYPYSIDMVNNYDLGDEEDYTDEELEISVDNSTRSQISS